MNPHSISPILVVIIVLGLLFFSTAVWAIVWAIRHGQFNKLEEGSRAVFTPEEPEGAQTDSFPKKTFKESAKEELKK